MFMKRYYLTLLEFISSFHASELDEVFSEGESVLTDSMVDCAASVTKIN